MSRVSERERARRGHVGAEGKPVGQVARALDHVGLACDEAGQSQLRQAVRGVQRCREPQIAVEKQITQVTGVGRVAQQRTDAEDFLQGAQQGTVRVIKVVGVTAAVPQR